MIEKVIVGIVGIVGVMVERLILRSVKDLGNENELMVKLGIQVVIDEVIKIL